ncbi:MAG: hypothetical protein MK213_03335 [Planctomycetes bacterium]|nr:hypothetical protein [Planctomycetota bacterium]
MTKAITRGLGFHRVEGGAAYALVERLPGQPPQVLASGLKPLGDLPDLHQKLRAEQPLSWCLAATDLDDHTPKLPSDWPRLRPQPAGLLTTATAAAIWEWELGRYSEGDILVWLRRDQLVWQEGEPGIGAQGVLARSHPLTDLWQSLQQQLKEHKPKVALAIDEQAPGLERLLEHFDSAGWASWPLTPPPKETGADRAALGAALAACSPQRPGVWAPSPSTTPNWVSQASLFGAALLLAFHSLRPAEPMDNSLAGKSEAATTKATPPPLLPENLDRLLDRRTAFVGFLDAFLQEAQAGDVHTLEILASCESRAVQARMQLSPESQLDPPNQLATFKLTQSTSHPRSWQATIRKDSAPSKRP